MNSLVRSILLGAAATIWSLSAHAAPGGGGGDDAPDPTEAHDSVDAADAHGSDRDASDHADVDHETPDVADRAEASEAADRGGGDAPEVEVTETHDDAPEAADSADSHGGGDDVADSADTHGGDDVADSTETHGGDDVGDSAESHGGDDVADAGESHGGADDAGGASDSHGGGEEIVDRSDSHGGSGSDSHGGNSGGGGSGDSGSNSGSNGSGDSGSGSGSSGGSGDSGSHGGSGDSGSHSGSGDSGSSGSSGSNSGSNNSGSSNGSGDQNASGQVQHADVIDVDHDAAGNERVAGEALMAGAQSDVDAAVANGFTLVSQMQMSSLDRIVARLRTPANETVDEAIVALQAIAPTATVTANNVYRSAESTLGPRVGARHARRAAVGVLGIIDTAADPATVDAARVVDQRSFVAGPVTPHDHGTIVASLAADHGMRVRIADVFGPSQDGTLAASADAISAAVDWMVANHVAVINISIEGPQNAILGQIVRAAVQSGHIIVAAAGNGGPLAAPAFPAAYDGAVAVTAIDNTNHAYRRANRGAYVAFAAPGVDVPVDLGSRALVVTGTSFSAPIVAARIATQLREPSVPDAQRVLRNMQSQAVDLGAPGRDPIYGWGAVRTE